MSTKISLEYFGMPGVGATVKEAKLDAGRKIEEALSRDYTPLYIEWRGTICLFFCDPKYGYGYRFIHRGEAANPHVAPIIERVWVNGGGNDRQQALYHCLLHIADVEHKLGDRECPLFDRLLSGVLLNEAKKEYRQKAVQNDRTNTRYRYAKDIMKLDENACHNFALMNPATSELWKDYAHIGSEIS